MLSNELIKQWECFGDRRKIASTIPTHIAVIVPMYFLGNPWFLLFYIVVGWGLVTRLLYKPFVMYNLKRNIWPSVANHVGFAFLQIVFIGTLWGCSIYLSKIGNI